jgi:hypothetical protein
MKSLVYGLVIPMIWVVVTGGSEVILPGYFIEGDDNSSTNTPGGTFALSDPSLARTSAAMFESLRTYWISSPWKFFSSFRTSTRRPCWLWCSPNLC